MSTYFITLYGLFYKETIRFLKIYHQTIFSPVLSSFMFVAILLLSNTTNSIEHTKFILTGSIISGILQNAFMNSSSSLVMSKVLGYVQDIIIPPITNSQIIIAYVCASLIRAITIGFLIFLVGHIFVDLEPYSFSLATLIVLLSATLLASLGLLSATFTDTFEGMASITNYFITPISMLSGTFFSVTKLPAILQLINQFNPFFYMIDSFRYAMSGSSHACIYRSILVLVVSNILVFTALHYSLKRGIVNKKQ